ncbi:hypothetical protein M513_06706 [Trichuris suis]|uniref:Lipoma HMGIC fusion partner-like protein n=1 Tax=Trichuris suis TaxID=68888 RepID=A0A085M529_9BILA|nr:hypothetical protein M513_06706 [Trichuris suis]
MVSSSLTTTGYAWSTLSALSAAIAAFGFYMPYWLKGELTLHQQTIPAYFNSFRRCNYPGAIQPTSYESFRQVIITKCGRYATFDDIPTLWWKITTIVVGIGASLTIFTAIITLSACCTRDVITRTTARIIGIFQILAGKTQVPFIVTCSRCADLLSFSNVYMRRVSNVPTWLGKQRGKRSMWSPGWTVFTG